MFADLVIEADLRRIAEASPGVFAALDGRRILLTGGTGFVGVWLLRTLLGAAELLRLAPQVVVLTRDPTRFGALYSELAEHRLVTLAKGDIRQPLGDLGRLDLVVHAAAETNVSLADPPALAYFTAGLEGTVRVAELARRAGAERIVLTSSGAVYGPAAFAAGGAAEDAQEAPPTAEPRAAYGNAKRAAESYLCALAASGGPQAVIARLFAFVGPDLPLRSGYAIGNFIADALAGGPVRVAGDGTPLRSYLYAADMALWLWSIAVEGKDMTVYNVGSERPVTIAELAQRVAEACGGGE